MILLKQGHLYGPQNLGIKDILIAGNEIVAIEDDINIELNNIEIIDCSGKNIYPGFIDGHVHITGGGGEGSFKTRTPEIFLSDITSAGVTTVVGCLGTDGTTRTMTNLLAKAYALEEEGITTYIYSGSYQVPLRSLMGDVRDDIVLIEKIIGVGEVAISDHRSSVPSKEELLKIASSARVGGILSGKAGIVNVHLGDGKGELDPLYEITQISDIPLNQFLPTHMNRNTSLFDAGITFAKAGGYIDFTTSTTEQFIEMGEVPSAKALKIALERGAPIEQITFTSDGQGSLPAFDEHNNFTGLQVGKLKSLYDSVVEAVKKEGVPLETALKVITSNPAKILKLGRKGKLKTEFDGDIVIAHCDSLEIETVIAKGKIMVRNKEVVVKGTFE